MRLHPRLNKLLQGNLGRGPVKLAEDFGPCYKIHEARYLDESPPFLFESSGSHELGDVFISQFFY